MGGDIKRVPVIGLGVVFGKQECDPKLQLTLTRKSDLVYMHTCVLYKMYAYA